jgi:hypothetical protein
VQRGGRNRLARTARAWSVSVTCDVRVPRPLPPPARRC